MRSMSSGISAGAGATRSWACSAPAGSLRARSNTFCALAGLAGSAARSAIARSWSRFALGTGSSFLGGRAGFRAGCVLRKCDALLKRGVGLLAALLAAILCQRDLDRTGFDETRVALAGGAAIEPRVGRGRAAIGCRRRGPPGDQHRVERLVARADYRRCG